TLDYTVPKPRWYIPRTMSLGYKLTDYELDYGDEARIDPTQDPLLVSPTTTDKTQDYTAKLGFQPLPGFTFNPNYSLSLTHEYKDVSLSSAPIPSDYDKLRSQTAGFDGVMTFKKWLAPRVRYSMLDQETYGIPLSVQPDAAATKNVDRTGT